jgi:hypothetical protein
MKPVGLASTWNSAEHSSKSTEAAQPRSSSASRMARTNKATSSSHAMASDPWRGNRHYRMHPNPRTQACSISAGSPIARCRFPLA